MYRIIVDVSPKTIPGTNGCHHYVFDSYGTEREAKSMMDQINKNGALGVATTEKIEY